jgi:diguanylate cyclase (GGDEF)-like protein
MKPAEDPIARLQALAEGFRQRSGAELRRMRGQLSGAGDLAAAEDLLPLLHRLAGSGATFGFEELGRLSRGLYRRLQTAPMPSLAEVLEELAAAQRALDRQRLPADDCELAAARAATPALPLLDEAPSLLAAASLKQRLEAAVGRARRSGRPLSVAVLGIDRWRAVNERRGRGAARQASAALAELLLQRVRRVDSVGRLPLGRFVVLLPDCSVDAAQRLLDDIRLRFAALRFRGPEDAGFSLTLSGGIVTGEQEAGILLEQADQALADARRAGRDQLCVH